MQCNEGQIVHRQTQTVAGTYSVMQPLAVRTQPCHSNPVHGLMQWVFYPCMAWVSIQHIIHSHKASGSVVGWTSGSFGSKLA
jgi:hypothetical protein